MTIDFHKLSSTLKRIRAQFPSRITRRQFIVNLKGILNASEADRLFDFYLCRDVIGAVSKTVFVFKQHQEYFSAESLVNIFEKNDIQTRHYCHFRDASQEQKDIMTLKRLEAKERKKLEKVSTKQVETTIKALSEFSDEELREELNRRSILFKKREHLKVILETIEMSLEDLKQLIADCE